MNMPQPALERFRVRRVVPTPEVEVTALIDGHDLVFTADDGSSVRYNLAEIAFEGTAGEFLWFGYKGNQNLLAVDDTEPMAFVEALLDARSQVRRDPHTQWSVGAVASESNGHVPVLPQTGAPALPVEARRVPEPTTRMPLGRFLVIAAIVLLVAVGGGRLIGELVNDASAAGVGDAVDVGTGLVVRDVSGVGVALLEPFSSVKEWRLEWENIAIDETELSVTAVRPDGSETVLVAGEPIGRGVTELHPGGSVRLRVESAGSWRLVVVQDD